MPAYTKKQQLIDTLTKRIESGEYQPGAKLPSGTELCAQFGVYARSSDQQSTG
ncbi:GntR family transcriptional regulator [Micromonospora thermarum]|uniref:GntR family transcriptional regulator n=1 Tax=Micromonospora thermarum TaxID=2720024 RepID=UPI001F0F66E1|nr:GntR family transcriptional regulator [Micromonospora thermarum]